MSTKKEIIVSSIMIVILGISLFYFAKLNTINNLKNQKPAESTAVRGCYVAKIGKDIYTLDIQSEDKGNVNGILAYNNYQKDSSSGSLTGKFENNKLLADYAFDGEGVSSVRQVIFKKDGDVFFPGFGPIQIADDRTTFENLDNISYQQNLPFLKTESCINHFTDTNNVFSFDYNSFFKVTNGDSIPTQDWRLNIKERGRLLTSILIPKTYLSGTNFSDARLSVGSATSTNAIKNCTTIDVTINEKNMGTVMISGYPFTKFTSNGAAAGNFYETTSHRGIFDGDCYVFESTIHSTNIGNYSPDQNIKEFDKTKIQNEIESIIKSFKFLISSD